VKTGPRPAVAKLFFSGRVRDEKAFGVIIEKSANPPEALCKKTFCFKGIFRHI